MISGPLIHRLRYFVTDAWDEWKHSPGVNLLAVGTLASVLFLAAFVMLVLANVESRVVTLQTDVRIEIYFADDSTNAQRSDLHRELEETAGVTRVVYVDKYEALRRYREWAGDHAELVDELETNPLPASLDVFLAPGPDSRGRGRQMVEELEGRPGLEDVRFDADWVERLEGLLRLARWGGSGLALIVFVAVSFVMASVLRLAVYARRDEIEIMLLVGATPAFVRGPFLVSGVGQGLIASVLALVFVELARRVALQRIGTDGAVLIDWIASRSLPFQTSLLVVAVGVVVGLAGAGFAVRRSV